MKLIGLLLLFLAAITGKSLANHHETISLSPSDHTLVRYTNESLIVQCHSSISEAKLHWKSPKGEIINEHKGRIHIEQSSPELKIVFAHISLADKGNWSCEDVYGGKTRKSFELIVYQKITFTENATIITVKEGKNATILCEVKGEPQPNVTWNFNGQPITMEANSTKFRILADGLLINKVTQNDTGEYTCRAYQVNPIASDMQERTVLMKIEHKPFWIHSNYNYRQYAYPNGTVSMLCEAIAEPPANFSWYRHKHHLHNDRHYTIINEPYVSTLQIHVLDNSVYNTYKCRAQNEHGPIERTIVLERGEKPPPPTEIQLRGRNSNTFDIKVGPVRHTNLVPTLGMNITGYRIEYISEYHFKMGLGKWTNAKGKEFPFGEDTTFLFNNLEHNTTYLMRAATRNPAGLSDWTKVEKFRTQSNEPPSSGTSNIFRGGVFNTFSLSLIIIVISIATN